MDTTYVTYARNGTNYATVNGYCYQVASVTDAGANGLTLEGHRAQQLTRELAAEADLVVCMEGEHAEFASQLGARRAFVVHGAGGIDELSPCGRNQVCEVVDGGVRERTIDPDALFALSLARPAG